MENARIEEEVSRSEKPNYGALNDWGMQSKYNDGKALLKFKDCSSQDFAPAFQYFGPQAMVQLGAHLGGLQELYDFQPLTIAFVKTGNEKLSDDEALEQIKKCGPLEIKNPHFFILNPTMVRIRHVFGTPNPNPEEIADTKDGLMLNAALAEYCDYGEKKFCESLFVTSVAELKRADSTKEQQAHAALLLAAATRLLPENGYDPFSPSPITTQAMIRHSIDGFYAKRGDQKTSLKLQNIIAELDGLPNQDVPSRPIGFAFRIYDDAFAAKVFEALEHDEHFVLTGGPERFRELLSPRPA